MPQFPRRQPSRPDEAELIEARILDQVKNRIEGMKAGIEVHVVSVVKNEIAPLATKVEEAVTRLRHQDERERIREEERARARLEEQSSTDRGLALIGRAIEAKGKQTTIVETAIDGTHRRRNAIIALAVTVATALGGLGLWSALSHALHH